MADKPFSLLPTNLGDNVQTLLSVKRPAPVSNDQQEGFKEVMKDVESPDKESRTLESSPRDNTTESRQQQDREQAHGPKDEAHQPADATDSEPSEQQDKPQHAANDEEVSEPAETTADADTSEASEAVASNANKAVADADTQTLTLDADPSQPTSTASQTTISQQSAGTVASVTEITDEAGAATNGQQTQTSETVDVATTDAEALKATTNTTTSQLATAETVDLEAQPNTSQVSEATPTIPVTNATNSVTSTSAAAKTEAAPIVDEMTLEVAANTQDKTPKVAVTTQLANEAANIQKPGVTTDVVLPQPLTERSVQKVSASGEQQAQPIVGVNRSSALAPQAAALKPQTAVTTPFNQPNWGQAVTEKVMWMSSQGIKEADIQLDPPELGPIQVKVTVQQDQAHVSFTVQNNGVREALDQNAMRLREMFASGGLDLVDVDVSDQSQSFQQGEGEGEQGRQSRSTLGADGEEVDVSETAISSANGYSLVDAYV